MAPVAVGQRVTQTRLLGDAHARPFIYIYGVVNSGRPRHRRRRVRLTNYITSGPHRRRSTR